MDLKLATRSQTSEMPTGVMRIYCLMSIAREIEFKFVSEFVKTDEKNIPINNIVLKSTFLEIFQNFFSLCLKLVDVH